MINDPVAEVSADCFKVSLSVVISTCRLVRRFQLWRCLLSLALKPNNVTSASSLTPFDSSLARCLSHNCHTCLCRSWSVSHVLRQRREKAWIIINSQLHCADTGIHVDSVSELPADHHCLPLISFIYEMNCDSTRQPQLLKVIFSLIIMDILFSFSFIWEGMSLAHKYVSDRGVDWGLLS